jgi:hypothetical protein
LVRDNWSRYLMVKNPLQNFHMKTFYKWYFSTSYQVIINCTPAWFVALCYSYTESLMYLQHYWCCPWTMDKQSINLALW